MRRLTILPLALAALLALGSCATLPARKAAITTPLTPELKLTLPTPPGYPTERTLTQTVRASYGDRKVGVEAVSMLSPERVEMVLTAPAGPRIATIVWDAQGVTETRSAMAPQDIEAASVLADLFLAEWPLDRVSAALPRGVTARETSGGGRSIAGPDGPIVDIEPAASEPGRPERVDLINHAFDYELAIWTREARP